MKLPKARQLPSGQWYMQIMVDGKRHNGTFETEEDALYWAAGLKTKSIESEQSPRNLTVGAAFDRYIESRSSILSPATKRGYKNIRKNQLESIEKIKLYDLTQEKIQRWVNKLSKEHSPKTVANAHGLLSGVLAEYRPSMRVCTTLPQKDKVEIQIPSEADIKAILSAAKGTKYELPILLGVWLGLRESEIIGLKWDCIDGDYITIKRAVVLGDDGPVEKKTKTTSGTRKVRLPKYIKDKFEALPHNDENIFHMSGKAIYSGFVRCCQKAGVQHYRFHDLRHLNASAMLAVGIPNAYSKKRMGHKTENMLRNVYQHSIKEKEQAYDDGIDSYFAELFDNK